MPDESVQVKPMPWNTVDSVATIFCVAHEVLEFI